MRKPSRRAFACTPLTLFSGMKPWTGRRGGQSLVELALVLPILLFIVIGGVDALQFAMARYTVGQATRAAVHQAALVGGDAPEVHDIAKSLLDGGLGTASSKATVTVTCPSGGCDRYQPVRVTIRYADGVFVPIGPFNTFDFSITATRASEQDPGAPGAGSCTIPGC